MLIKRKHTDGLKLHRALPGQYLIPLVAAMTFLAALTIAGVYATKQLANRWNAGAATTIILQIPEPNDPLRNDPDALPKQSKLEAIISILSTAHDLNSFHKLDDKEIDELLAPWLHEDVQTLSLPIPAIIELHVKTTGLSDQLQQTLKASVPDIVIEQSNIWTQRLNSLANSLRTSAFMALVIVILVAASVIALSTRSGLIQCKQTIEILHNLGASDSYISFRFARQNAFLSFIGGSIGSLLSIPLLLILTYLSLPFSSDPNWQSLANAGWLYFLFTIPFKLLLLFILLPICNYIVGWITTSFIVYFWLRHLT